MFNHKASISQSVSAFSCIFIGLSFLWNCPSSSIEQFPKRNASEVAKRKIFKIKEFADTLLFLSHQCMFWPNFTEIRPLYIPYKICLKRKDSFEKRIRVFALQRFVNTARLIREICQHEKPPANEIMEPPAVDSKQTRASRESYSFGHVLCTHALGQDSHRMGETKNKAIFKEKKGNQGASADVRL